MLRRRIRHKVHGLLSNLQRDKQRLDPSLSTPMGLQASVPCGKTCQHLRQALCLWSLTMM